MTEKSGCIKNRRVGNKTSENEIPSEGFGIEDKDEDNEKDEENTEMEEKPVVAMQIPSIFELGCRSNQVYFS